MKKIVGIIAAVAMIATSVFAADISAATKISGSIFGIDKDKKVEMLNERNDSHDYANPNFSMSVSGDKAGASVNITTNNYGGSNEGVSLTSQSIWFKPFDAFTVKVGNFDVALNKEQIDWTESKTGLGGNGFLFSINTSGFGLDFGLTGHEGAWFSKADGTDAVLKQFFFKVAYGADFGNIGAFASFNDDNEDGKNGTSKASTIKNIKFGAGYRNNFDGLDVFLNVVGWMGDKFDWIRPELYLSGSVDSFGYSLFAAPQIWTNGDLNKSTELELIAKVTFGMDGFTPYAYFKAANILASTFNATIKVGANGSIGAVGWNTWAQFEVADKAFSVPFELSLSF